MASEIRVNKIINRSGLSTVTFSDTGAIVSGIVTANSFSGNVTGNVTGSGANLTSIPAGQLTGTVADARLTSVTASKLSGALPAIDGSSLTGINTAFGSGTSVNTSGIITATAFVPTSQGALSHRNLVINGAMMVSQRGTSFSGTAQRYTLDRMQMNTAGNDEIAQTEQAAVTAGGAYTSGFRKCMKIINGNQTSGAGAGDLVHLKMVLEAQDIANSGWNYTSSSSFVTLSFWIKSSIAQDFPITLRSEDGTRQVYNMTTGSLTANTWTKVTKTIPGNSNLQFDDNVNAGLTFFINAFAGTDYTTGSLAQNAWSAWSGAKQGDNMTTTWYTTNDATLEFTGIQLEVGPVATPFEHRSFAQEALLCKRYYQQIVGSGDLVMFGSGRASGTSNAIVSTHLAVPLRASPTISSLNYSGWGVSNAHTASNKTPVAINFDSTDNQLNLNYEGLGGQLTNGRTATVSSYSGSTLTMDSEL